MALTIVAISGSPRKGGNTELLCKKALESASKHGCKTEFISLRAKNIKGCIACGKCWEKKDGKCHGIKDDFHEVWEKMKSAHGLVLASPTYFGSCTAELKALMDRAGNVSMANDYILAGKAGAPIVTARRAGAMTTYSQIAIWYPINGMILVGSSYWNVGFGLEKGEVEKDEEALETVEKFGANLAQVVKKLFA